MLINLSWAIDEIANEFDDVYGFYNLRSLLCNDSLKWLITKQIKFSGDSYFDQIEKNAVYLKQSIMTYNNKCAVYLHNGSPVLQSSEEVDEFLFSSKEPCLKATGLHLNFIRCGCHGCDSHDQHSHWIPYQKMRQMDIEMYKEELEFSCICYQALLISSRMFLRIFLQNPQFSGQFKQCNINEVYDMIEDKIWSRTKKWIRLTILGSERDAEQSINKSNWRDIWKDQYLSISEEMSVNA